MTYCDSVPIAIHIYIFILFASIQLYNIIYSFFSLHSKALFTSVHYFVHLNLAVALFLGYAVFVAGIDYGTRHRVSADISANKVT